MQPTKVEQYTTSILKELQDNIDLPLVVSPGRRAFIETNVQLLLAHFPNATPKSLYYSSPDIYETLPGRALHDALERVAAASFTQDPRRL